MNTIITKEVFRYLANHTWEIQKNKIKIVNQFSKDFNAYMCMLNFINAYIKRIDNFLDQAKTGSCTHLLPFVILDSIVHVSYQAEGGLNKYKIILEVYQKDIFEAEINTVSCLTEIANSLLFKKNNEEVLIKNNGKTAVGKIEKIEFDLML